MRASRPGIARTLSNRARAGAPPPQAGEAAPKIDTLLDGIRAMAERLAALGEQGGTSGERTIDLGGREGRMVFGYTVRTGLDGAREAAPFGDIPRPAAKAQPAPRTPITDLFEEPDAFVVIVELPGAQEADISLSVQDATLLVTASGAHPYEARITIPGAIDPAGLTRSLRNGILEIRLPRAGGPGA